MTRFRVRAAFLSQYQIQRVGSAVHEEYWIPASDIYKLNRSKVGPIEVIAKYHNGEIS